MEISSAHLIIAKAGVLELHQLRQIIQSGLANFYFVRIDV